MSERVAGTVIGRSRSERFHDVEARIRRVTYLLDEIVPIPGTGQKVGFDPVIGLIPVVGDAVAALVGSWIVLEAARFGIPRLALARMVVNLLVDLALGAIPLVGDIFDIVSRSNSANLEIFRRHALDPDASTAGHRAFFIGLVLMLVGAIWLVATIMLRVFEAFWRAVLG